MRQLLQTIIPLLAICLLISCSDNSAGPDSDNGENGEDDELATYTVSISKSPSDAGSVDPSTNETYEEGETVELMARSDEKFRFTEWTGDIESSENPLLLTVDKDYELTANFEKKSYALTINKEGEGVVNEEVVQEKSTDYEHGTVVELTATPSEEYKFVEWSGDLSGSENPAQITVDEAKEVTAIFEARTGTVEVTTLTSGENQDSDGYAFSIGDKEHRIGVNETITIEGLEEGSYDGELTGLAENCTVDSDNPKSVEVSGGETTSVTFEVYCEASTSGSLEITTSTSGQEQDEDGYTVSIAEQEESIGSNETITINDIEVGSYDVELSGIAGNCSVDGDNPRTVDITAGETTSTSFDVSCEVDSQEKIVFTSDEDGDWDIHMMNPDGTGEKDLTNEIGASDGNEQHAAISHDGTKIAYSVVSHEIEVMNVDGSESEEITTNSSGTVKSLSWSPDDSQIIFSDDRTESYNYQIYVINVDGSNVEQLTTEGGEYPSWSPNGDKIAFQKKYNGEYQIYTMNPDGSDMQRLTDASYGAHYPSWSPDGSKIAYTSHSEIIIMNENGTNKEKVISGGTTPYWSPDGTQIVFSHDGDIIKMNSDGSGDRTTLADDSRWEGQPFWGIIK